MESELIRRAEDLFQRCERTCGLTCSGFLTPAEGYQLQNWAKYRADVSMLLHGGIENAERCCAFFLPFYMDEAGFEPEEYFRCVKITAGFGQPGHRDYMGAVLGLGIKREWIGDILVEGGVAHVVCLPTVAEHLLASLDKVGRYGVKTTAVELCKVPVPKREVKEVSFSVKSLRLDAVVGGMFNVSRTQAAEAVAAGLVSLNYAECLKTDAAIRQGDIISLRGKGKGTVAAMGGVSKKGRLFVTAEVLK